MLNQNSRYYIIPIVINTGRQPDTIKPSGYYMEHFKSYAANIRSRGHSAFSVLSNRYGYGSSLGDTHYKYLGRNISVKKILVDENSGSLKFWLLKSCLSTTPVYMTTKAIREYSSHNLSPKGIGESQVGDKPHNKKGNLACKTPSRKCSSWTHQIKLFFFFFFWHCLMTTRMGCKIR